MNLVVTPLSSDFKKMEQGSASFLGVGWGVWGFLPPNHPLRRRPHANHVHLKVKITNMGSAAQRGGGVEPPPKFPLAEPCSIFFKVTTNFERLYTWSV